MGCVMTLKKVWEVCSGFTKSMVSLRPTNPQKKKKKKKRMSVCPFTNDKLVFSKYQFPKVYYKFFQVVYRLTLSPNTH